VPRLAGATRPVLALRIDDLSYWEAGAGTVDYHPFKAKVNSYFARHVGGDRRPTYFDIDGTYPALNELTRNYSVIREEFERVLGQKIPMPAYHDLDAGEREISAVVNPDKRWSVFMLYILGYKPELNRALCPATCRILDSIPGLVQAFFSVLDPGKSVPAHDGPYLGYLRYHLGLRVPAENPPCLIVNGQKHVWRAGQAVMFDDSWTHEVINHSKEVRAVLIVDVLRPMPRLASLVNKFVTYGIMRPLYGRALARKAERAAAQAAVDQPE